MVQDICDAPPDGRAVVHLHGGHQAWQYDGNAFAWYTPGYASVGPDWREKVYAFPNSRAAGAALWYHDHAACVTRLNVYAGLAGMYILRDPELEARLGLPTGEFEMPLMIMDRGLNPDGSLQYPAELVPEYFTNVSIVNGQAWPKMTVQPARYRFRLLAAGNARFFNLQLFVVDKTTGEPDFKRPGPPFVVIAGEGGFFEEPVTVDGRMLVAPAERYDIVIDFTNFAGQKLLLHNDAGTPYSGPGAASGNEVPLPDIMQFHVKKAAAKEEVAATPDEDALPVAAAPIATPGPLPKRLVPRSEPVPAITKDTPEWRIDLNEYTDDQGRLMLLLEHSHCSDPILTKPVVNQTSVFAFVNPTPDWHPMHMHLVSFHVLGHTPFDLALYEATGEVVPTGPTEGERGTRALGAAVLLVWRHRSHSTVPFSSTHYPLPQSPSRGRQLGRRMWWESPTGSSRG